MEVIMTITEMKENVCVSWQIYNMCCLNFITNRNSRNIPNVTISPPIKSNLGLIGAFGLTEGDPAK